MTTTAPPDSVKNNNANTQKEAVTSTVTSGVEIVNAPNSALTAVSATDTVINIVDAHEQNTAPRKPKQTPKRYDPSPTPRKFSKKSKSNESQQPSTTNTTRTSAEPTSTNPPSKEASGAAVSSETPKATSAEPPELKTAKELAVKETVKPPEDKYNVVLAIMVLHGLGTLIAWNVFMTISPLYFQNHKLGADKMTGVKPWYIANFINFICLCGQIPNLVINGISLFIEKGSMFWRVVGSLIIVFVFCLMTVILIFVDTSTWKFGFFMLTMVKVVILNTANGFYQNTVFGLVGNFPTKYINAVMVGNNCSGVTVTLICILVTQFISDPAITATVYFCFALIGIIACIVSFIYLQRNKFYLHYKELAEQNRQGYKFKDYLKIFKVYWPQLLNVATTFTISFFLFPSVLINIKLYPAQRAEDHDTFISVKQYSNVVVFLSFCVFCLIGNTTANFIHFPKPKLLSVLVFLRLLFIPFFYVCNYAPDDYRSWEPLIKNEWIANVMMMFCAYSHGHVSALAMMYAPLGAPADKQRIIGKMSSFCLIFGVVSGILLSFVAKYPVH
uniref:Nucleoside transporter n=1 Tax=Panagrellus redivivus TaxID=6233 RepID=A0A7E4UME9_PANRE